MIRNDFYDFSKAKVVCDINGRLLYSSRAGIPLNNKGKFVSAERAIWIYAFHKEGLNRYFDNNSRTKLDKIEDNEIIRFLKQPESKTHQIHHNWSIIKKKKTACINTHNNTQNFC